MLWDYDDEGLTKYRINATGESCEKCQSINGKIFNIADAVIGKNLSPLHPNCDCTIEILDAKENVVFTNEKNKDNEQDWEKYLQTSLRQFVLGNYTEDVNLLGTILQVLAGLVGVDLSPDIRDLFYDITNFELALIIIISQLIYLLMEGR